MSNKDHAKGRADAAKGKYDPPQHSVLDTGLLDSKKQMEATSVRKENYREGYYDKKNETKSK